jgi:Kef-type K+ transport system membrane component KefB
LSPALGTFLAGVVLADSEYRHELESDIEPFKGLLLGIYFISIGASLNFSLISEQFWLIGGLVAGLILVKAMILFVIAKTFKMPGNERLLFAVALAQGGEFGFVLFSFARLKYQQHNADLAELMKKNRKIDMAELDKAWTTANPET